MSPGKAILSCVALLAAGCGGPLTNENAPARPSEWEELHVSYSHRMQKWRWREGLTVDQPPEDAYRVTVTAQSVEVPFPPSASDGGESATVVFGFRPGLLPCFPKCRRIVMRYNPAVNPFKEGSTHIVVFLSDGRFWGGTTFQF